MKAVQQTPQIMGQTENEASGLRILVADDNMDAADSLALLLRLEGHEVAVEYNGVTALARFHSMKPHAALLDLGMPKMTGYELAKEIRKIPDGLGTYLVAVSGWGAARDKAATAVAGFDCHLVKPPDFDVLRELIRCEVADRLVRSDMSSSEHSSMSPV